MARSSGWTIGGHVNETQIAALALQKRSLVMTEMYAQGDLLIERVKDLKPSVPCSQ
jgi:hypothetical protein